MLGLPFITTLMRILALKLGGVIVLMTCWCLVGCTAIPTVSPVAEVRGTWLTTTANDSIASPANTALTMRRLSEIGLNTVYVEAWKSGETQFPSAVLARVLGAPAPASPPRDLMQETLIEAHRNGLIYIAWFEYGFMAAHRTSMNRLRTQKAAWFSRDISGNEIAPNGFVWMNPLHPEARRLLLNLVLEAIDKYDLDGVQFDDRLVWPHISMGYDDYTKEVYAAEHDGNSPPADYRDPAWMRWRANKVNEVAKWFVQEMRVRRPSLVISLSPAPYPWSWANSLLAWPAWTAWTYEDRLKSAAFQSTASQTITPRWDEFIPQAYRMSYDAFAKTWREQMQAVTASGANRQRDLVAGIRVVGEGNDSSWPQLADTIAFVREQGNGGHVLWFSRGVLDLYPAELAQLYKTSGPARSPHFAPGWRSRAVTLSRLPSDDNASEKVRWSGNGVPRGHYRLIGFAGGAWHYLDDQQLDWPSPENGQPILTLPAKFTRVELIADRREEMSRRSTRGNQ